VVLAVEEEAVEEARNILPLLVEQQGRQVLLQVKQIHQLDHKEQREQRDRQVEQHLHLLEVLVVVLELELVVVVVLVLFQPEVVADLGVMVELEEPQ
jgi:hypothetical protein